MSDHPNFFDRLAVKIYPRYLYAGQICQSISPINIGMIHRLPDIRPRWKVVDYLYLKKGSTMKYLGLAKSLKIEGEITPMSTILELINPDVDESKSPGKHISPGDLITISQYDRQFLNASTPPDPTLMDKLSGIIAPDPEP